jgi:hypothetical protein
MMEINSRNLRYTLAATDLKSISMKKKLRFKPLINFQATSKGQR